MKRLASAMLGLLLLGLWLPRVANVADVDWLGRISALGGAERQTHETKESVGSGSHGLAQTELLSVIPITPIFGIQLQGGYANMFGHGQKFGGQAGPIVSFGMGKAGFFVTDQFHLYNDAAAGGGLRSANFVWLTPAVALYDLLPATNLDIWFAQQISRHNTVVGKRGDGVRQLAPTSSLRAAMNFFPPGLPFGNGNTELTFGVQVNGVSGPDRHHALSGAGPVAGVAFMPWQNMEVQLFKMTVDNRSRFQVLSGVQFFFSPSGGPLIQQRRKYLEPTNMPQQINTKSSF
ncbi:MAG TPA: hypothetical protein VL754_02105 [Verrucomicrobiae bacterium]|nr:hypothetical protein [Verrucomicrobiae bacterium]